MIQDRIVLREQRMSVNAAESLPKNILVTSLYYAEGLIVALASLFLKYAKISSFDMLANFLLKSSL